jgi:hypothetical protein
MTEKTDVHLLVIDTFKKVGVWIRTSQYLVHVPPFTSCSATHLLRTELIRLFTVSCGMLSHSSSIAVQSCWILAGTGTCCSTHRSRASKTCSMGDMSGEYTGHGRTGIFSASRNCVQILATWSRALPCWNTLPQNLSNLWHCHVG